MLLVLSKVTLQIVASLIDAARGVIYDRNMAIPHVYGTGIICDGFIIQATDHYLLAFTTNFSHVDPNLTLATFIGVGSPLIYCPISITLSI
jgi:hypothetical protein